MKKLLLSAALAASVFSVFAEKVRLATVVVAGRPVLMQAVNKIGELSCNAMLGGLAQGALADQPENATVYAVTVEDDTPDFEKIENPKKQPKLGKGIVAQLSVNAKNVAAFVKTRKEFAQLPEETQLVLSELTKFTVLVRVDDKGITGELKIALAKDSKIAAKYPSSPLAKNALAFAGKECLLAAVTAENTGSNYGMLREVVKLVEKQGIKLDFLTVTGDKGDSFVTLDATRVKASVEAQEEAFEAFDAAAFQAAMTNLQAKTLATPAGKFTFALKGYQGQWTPAERFAATLPEATSKTLVAQGVISYYGLLKALAPTIVAQADLGPMAEQAKTLVAGLPAEQKGAVAYAMWQNDPTSGEAWLRISADEIKSFGLASSSVMALAMSSAMAEADDDDDEEDDDDDSSDED